jgi:adenylate kinase
VNIILIGAQGSGKSTQAEKLSLAFGLCHVSSGDLFRRGSAERNESGFKAKTYLKMGQLVPDDITIAVVLERIQQPDCLPGIVLDGFPRTLAQAQALDHHFQRMKRHINLAIYLEVPREELLRRLSGRYLCRANQHIYNISTHPPKKPGVCDIDGSELYQRADDTVASVQKRLDIFFNDTLHLLDYYQKQHKLVKVNGYQDIDQVYTDIVRVLQSPVGSEEG